MNAQTLAKIYRTLYTVRRPENVALDTAILDALDEIEMLIQRCSPGFSIWSDQGTL